MSKPLILEHDNELYYRAGETDTFRICTGGFVTNSKKSFYFTIPLNKDATGLNISVISGNVTIRSADGTYVESGSDITENTSFTIVNNGKSLVLIINYNASKDVVNNTPVGIDIKNLILQFS